MRSSCFRCEVSTYDTDYILVKGENLDRAVEALRREGYGIV